MPISKLYRICTFYKAFSLTPRGKYVISVCAGTACHIKGAPRLTEKLCRELNININETTEDGLFSLESVRCLGCCSLAPVIKVNDRIYAGVTISQIPKIIKEYKT